jgi:class 3 adenylate cyclase
MALYTQGQLWSLAGGVLAATSMLWLGIVGFSTGSGRRPVNVLALAVFLVSAWYSLWVGIAFSGLLEGCRRLAGMSMLLGGMMGPLGYLFFRALLQPLAPMPRRWPWMVACGAFGAALALYLAADEARAEAIWQAYLQGRLLDSDRVALALFAVHSAQLMGFMGLAALEASRFSCDPAAAPRQRKLAWLLLATLAAAFAGIVVTNVLPALMPALPLGGLASLSILPAVGLVYFTLRENRELLRDLEEQRGHMSRYLPGHLVRQIVAGARLRLGGEEAEATVLFSDIRAFTTLSEALPPEEVVRFLNRYLALMTEVVFRHDGMVDKFIGDAVLAVFGVPRAQGRDAAQALGCARDMLRELEGFNAWWAGQGHRPIAVGIGLHRGKVVHGNIGSTNRVEYTVIGDTVNAASRVAGLNKELDAPVLLTGEVLEALGQEARDVRFLESRVLRGRRSATRLYALDVDGAG